MIKQLVFDVVWEDRLWKVKLRGAKRLTGISLFINKRFAVSSATSHAVAIGRDMGVSCQVVIYGKNGKIQKETSYPLSSARIVDGFAYEKEWMDDYKVLKEN